MKQDEKLSYSRLITRTKYFQEKSLELEKELIFVKDHLASVENKLEHLRRDNEMHAQSSEFATSKINEKEKELDLVKKEINILTEERVSLKKQLERINGEVVRKNELINKLTIELQAAKEASQRTLSDTKSKEFENLLGEMQIEINEKDKQVQHYKTKVKDLEKRLKLQGKIDSPPDTSNEVAQKNSEYHAIAYFSYSIIINDKKSAIVRGDLQIVNDGPKKLENPVVCYRFKPEQAAVLKGKILTVEQAEMRGVTSSIQWTYMESDWMENAKERGEIWICPLGNTSIQPGQSISFENFQIPVKSELDQPFVVEGFIYFHEQDYKIKVGNHIAVSF